MVYGLEKFKEYFGDYTNQYVFRLLANVLPSSKVGVDKEIEEDIILFIEMIHQDRPDLKNLGIKGVSFDEMITLLKNIYLK